MSYFDIYKKRVNRWGENYQDRLFNMRAQNFENQLKKSVYLVEFPYQDKDEQGEFVRYKQDETETLHYLLTRHNVFLEPGSIYHFLNARKEEVPWMVHYFEEQPARGYNKYIMLKMSHLVKWEDSKGDARETYAYFFSNVNTALSDAIKTSSEASIFFENDNKSFLIIPRNDFLEKDDTFEIDGQWYRVLGYNKFSTKGVEYVTVDPIYRKDTSPKPVQKEEDNAEDFFWLNGGEYNG
jgi:hypothetical protein